MVWEPKLGCCCCATPRTGTLILGWIGVITAVLGLLGAARMAAMPREQVIKMCHSYEKTWGKIEEESDASCYDNSLAGIITGVVEQLIQGGIAVLLIVGVNKRNQCMMIPYMILQVLGIIAFGIGFLVVTIIALVVHQWLLAFILLLVGGSITFLFTYFFLVVRVCFKEVKAQQVAIDNDIEVGFMDTQGPSHPIKSIFDTQSSSPPHYSKLDDCQESFPPTYYKVDGQASAPPPYSM